MRLFFRYYFFTIIFKTNLAASTNKSLEMESEDRVKIACKAISRPRISMPTVLKIIFYFLLKNIGYYLIFSDFLN